MDGSSLAPDDDLDQDGTLDCAETATERGLGTYTSPLETCHPLLITLQDLEQGLRFELRGYQLDSGEDASVERLMESVPVTLYLYRLTEPIEDERDLSTVASQYPSPIFVQTVAPPWSSSLTSGPAGHYAICFHTPPDEVFGTLPESVIDLLVENGAEIVWDGTGNTIVWDIKVNYDISIQSSEP